MGNCQESGLSVALLREPLPLAFAVATQPKVLQVPAVLS